MTYRLQYNSSEYRGLLASSLMAWAAEDRDLAIVSLEGHVLYTSRRLLALFSPTLAPLLTSSYPTTLPTSLSLPYSSSTLTALLSLLTSGQASCSSPLGREVEELATLLAIPINCAAPSAVKMKNNSLAVLPVKQEVNAAMEEPDTKDTPSKKGRKRGPRKNFPCAICQKPFDRKGLLNKHMANSHTEAAAKSVVHGESHRKPATHECEVCHKSFQSSGALRMHGAIHLSEKPFKCHLCEWQGTQKGNFKNHLRNRHGEDPDNILDLSGAPVTAEVALDGVAKEVEEEGAIGKEVVVEEEEGEGGIDEEMKVETEEEEEE